MKPIKLIISAIGPYAKEMPEIRFDDFDEKGHLIKTTDYDAPFTFTFEDILAYCRAHRIEVTKGYQSIGFHNRILRFVNDDGSCYWVIKHLKRYDLIEAIYLDGKTGKELKRQDIKYHNN